ncbi:putative lipid scramblase CLPTM1 [Oppia nitens]|uniref:putative lipid scramblase CLPTM1 n=1 Tax=Oppia nitens TaxID=1686743 RepID=UPI0023DA20BA|nr:putative lipid scramblase CLPTM1 [Oppia nitens]
MPDQVARRRGGGTAADNDNTTAATARENGQQVVGAAVGDGQQQLEQQQPPPQPQGSRFWSVAQGLIFRALIIYFITSFFRGKSTPPQQTPGADGGPNMKPAIASSNLFPNGTVMDLYLYICEEEVRPDFDDSRQLVWMKKGLVYGDWTSGPTGDGIYTNDVTVSLTPRVQNNGSLWLHIYVTKSGHTPYPSKQYSSFAIHKRQQLNRYKKRYYKKTHNLLTGETSATLEEQTKVEANIKQEILSHWHPNLTINIIDDHTPWVRGSVPVPLDEFVEFEPTTGKYYPIVYVNDYWNLMRDYMPINDTVDKINLHLTYQPLSMFRWQLYTAQAMRSRWTSFMGSDLMEQEDDEQDLLKETFLETSPILLGLTVLVSITHSVFEFLAFKNDIQFWKNRRSLEGLSVRSVFFNVFQSVIVLLYVLDNDTNMIIRFSVGIGLLIELWKIKKVINIEVNFQNKLFGLVPRVWFTDKGSYVESSTRQYDLLAFKYLSWALFPLLVGYSVYSLLYNEHKGWYSFTLNMIYGFLLTFGFIMMTPQLFINYKLKSVAHLPWRMLTYKFLNTFIDDIFAFVIKMPTMYRLGCFRDDIIFLIFLYQRWIYRVDHSRVNEFGISGDDIAAAGGTDNVAIAAVTDGSGGEVVEADNEAAANSNTLTTTKNDDKKKKNN